MTASGPTSADYVEAIGRGASTEEIAKKLSVSVMKARRALRILRNMTIIVETGRDQWRKS